MAEGTRISAEEAQEDAPGVVRRLLRLLGAAALAGLSVAGGRELLRLEPLYLPVRVVSVEGEVRRMSRDRLQQTVVDQLHGGILTQDLASLKEAVEAMPWVRSASLRRVWPDRLDLRVREHEPLARWGADGLVSAEGVVFRPDLSEVPGGFATLSAVDEQAPAVVARYLDWRGRFAGLGLAVEAVDLDPRGAWRVRMGDGLTLELGKADIDERLARFLVAWPSLAEAGRPGTVDMRYSNGLAVTWAEPEDPPAAGEPSRTAGAGAPRRIGPRNRS